MAQTLIQRSRSKRPSEKAQWNNETRKFFELSAADEDAIERELGVQIDTNLRKSEG